MTNLKSLDDLPATLNATDISNYLRLSRGAGYTLLNDKEFPTLKIGKRLVVTKESFIKWIEENTSK